MAEFDKLHFFQLLREAPERRPLLEEPQFSEYLKTQVFDKLKRDGALDLLNLDLSGVLLRDLVPRGYPAMYEEAAGGWAQGLNSRFRQISAAHLKQQTFF